MSTTSVSISKSMSVSSSSSSSEDEKTKRNERTKAARRRIVPYGVTVPDMPLPIDVITLCGQGQRDASLYCGPNKIRRRKVYKQENPREYKKVARKTTIKVLKEDAGKNTTIMAISVGIFGGLGAIGFVGTPAIGGPTTGVGAALGFAVGGYLINKYVNKKISIAIDVSAHYAGWRNKAIANKVYPIFKNFIDTDKVFEDFMCPLLQDICSIPMLAPDGKTYDNNEICKYIDYITDDADDHVTSPIRNGTFSKNDLIFNTQYCRDLIVKAETVYLDVVKYGRDNEIQHGVAAVIKNTQDLMECIRVQVAFQVWYTYDDQVRRGEMTEERRGQIIRESTSQWDFKDSVLKTSAKK